MEGNYCFYLEKFSLFKAVTKQQQNVLIKLNDINYAKNKKRDFSLRQKSHFIYA